MGMLFPLITLVPAVWASCTSFKFQDEFNFVAIEQDEPYDTYQVYYKPDSNGYNTMYVVPLDDYLKHPDHYEVVFTNTTYPLINPPPTTIMGRIHDNEGARIQSQWIEFTGSSPLYGFSTNPAGSDIVFQLWTPVVAINEHPLYWGGQFFYNAADPELPLYTGGWDYRNDTIIELWLKICGGSG